MKTVYTVLFCLSAVLCTTSCADKITEEQNMNVPVYLSYETLRSSVRSSAARELVHPGKIYFKDHYILIVEYRQGIHLVDISNPSQPQNKVFIEVPGCTDMAIKNHSLYADSYVDLVVIDLSDLAAPQETQRLKDVLPYTLPVPENTALPYAAIDEEKGIVTGWEVKREKRELERRYYPSYPVYYEDSYAKNDFISGSYGAERGGSGAASFGKSGSMARFGLYDNYLYIADNYQLYLFNVSDAAKPHLSGQQWVSGLVETLFIYDGHVFFGTPTGMTVYSLRIPSTPQLVGSFWHVTSCDPVVVQDGYAYITLRGGTNCNNSTVNRLDVVHCSADYKYYDLINSYDLTEPYGLGIDNHTLFVCDGKAGLKVYDVADKQNIDKHLLASFPSIQTYDVIPVDGYLFMIGSDGFYLYDYSDIQNIRQVGHIPVTKD
ncbi:MAG: hypothetical protein LBS46_01220 [Dysgonamonadaceae bacterium]|jgi:hypothetical protein|nr:hypothetical protein [Dysgonamonadaceae bacterium]